MGYTYQGDAILNVSLTVDTPKPLDTRSVVNNISELYNLPAKTAYPGMTVANIDNGNIYMLVDKSKINEKAGWKASYESIQIITCTQEEYDEWLANTTEDFKPIDESKTYLHAETYYYIYEDDQGQYYLSSAWGKDMETRVNSKASSDSVAALMLKVEEDIKNLADNYTTTDTLLATYATIASIEDMFNLEDPESYVSKLITDYYTKIEIDDKFVTKESLRGESTEGEEDDFIFVTQTQYAKDQEAIQEELDKTLKVDGEGSLDSITVGQIKSPVVEGEEQLIVNIKSDGVYIGEDPIATESDIPVLITIEEEDYNKLVEENKVQEDAYYYIYNTKNSDLVYVTLEQLKQSYDTRFDYRAWVGQQCYSKTEIDDIVETLQQSGDYVTNDQLTGYYTNTQIDSKFLTVETAASTYATQQSLIDLGTKISDEYVTKEMLKGSDTEDEDFIFITQTQYSSDKEAQAKEFSTEKLNSLNITTSEVTIQKIEEKEVVQEGTEETVIEQEITSSVTVTTEDNRLCVGEDKIAYVNEIPKIECITQTKYDEMVESGDVQEDTYYYTYDETGTPKNTYITLEYLQTYYVPKTQVQTMIQEAVDKLVQRIEVLEETVAELGSSSSYLDQAQLNKMKLG